MAAPKTVKTYALDGTKREFAITFEYLARKFVVVTLIGATRKELILNTDYRFTTPTSVTTTVSWGPSQGFDLIEIRRYTSAEDRLVDFADGSILRAYDLNTAQVQSLHIAEEARDLTADTIGVNNDGQLDARGRRVVNLADGIDPGDAVTLRQQYNANGTALNAAAAALVSQTAAEASKTLAQAAANTASDKAVSSATSAATATAQATIATNAVNSIGSSVDEAAQSATSANQSKLDAAQSATSANNSKTAAEAAKVIAQNAAQTADTAGFQMGMSVWGTRGQPFKGFALDDGQELDRAVYPDFAAALDSGLIPTISEASWQENPNLRGWFVANSSPGKFRMRDLNGASAGSIGGTFLRGSSANTLVIRQDQIQDHRHPQSEFFYGDSSDSLNGGTNVSETSPAGNVHGNQSTNARPTVKVTGLPTDKKWSSNTAAYVEANPVRHGAETYPTHAVGAWMTRLYGLITPLGSAEASSLATAYASVASRVGVLESKVAPLLKAPKWEKVLLTSQAAGNGAILTLSDDAFNYERFSGWYTGAVGTHMFIEDVPLLAAEPLGTFGYLPAAPNQYIYCKFADTNPAQRRMLQTIQFAANSGFTNLYGWRRIGYQ